MHFTTVICTRNRAAQLAQTLESLAQLTVPTDLSWSVVVVNNGSTDDTSTVVASFQKRLNISLVDEARAGLSNARNAGIDAAVGDLILWTDDDVIVDSNWLIAYQDAFLRHPNAAIFGGTITPVLQAPTPKWFSANQADLGFLLARRDFGPKERALSIADDCIPYGANFAIRLEQQRKYRYDPMLGVAPGRRTGGEETAVVKAILADGGEGRWVPDAAVQHIIPAHRQTMEYVRDFYEAMGECWAASVMKDSARRRAPLSTYVKLPVVYARLKSAEALKLNRAIRYKTSFSYHHGALKAFRLHARRSSEALV